MRWSLPINHDGDGDGDGGGDGDGDGDDDDDNHDVFERSPINHGLP